MGAPTSFQVEVEVNVASTAIRPYTWAYVPLLQTDAGDDTPDLAMTYKTDATDNKMLFYIPMDYPAQYVSAEIVGTGTTSGKTYTVDMWVTWQTER